MIHVSAIPVTSEARAIDRVRRRLPVWFVRNHAIGQQPQRLGVLVSEPFARIQRFRMSGPRTRPRTMILRACSRSGQTRGSRPLIRSPRADARQRFPDIRPPSSIAASSIESTTAAAYVFPSLPGRHRTIGTRRSFPSPIQTPVASTRGRGLSSILASRTGTHRRTSKIAAWFRRDRCGETTGRSPKAIA